MMFDPELFYEECLKEKNAEQIMVEIYALKQEIEDLKNIMEHPNYEVQMFPSELTRLKWDRLYLARAKEALAEVGGTYTMSEEELYAKTFEDSIPAICKVVFSIDDFLGGYETRTYILDEQIHISIEHSLDSYPSNSQYDDCSLSKDDFFYELKELYIGEWYNQYDLSRFGYEAMDGISWKLEFTFSNDHKPVKIYGDNAYPYNFNELQELLEIKMDSRLKV